MRVRLSVTVVSVVAAIALGSGCSNPDVAESPASPPEVAHSGLPRTTKTGILISVAESEQKLPVEGCGAEWLGRGEEPPSDPSCVVTKPVQTFRASIDGKASVVRVIWPIQVDPQYLMQKVASRLGDGVYVVVVRPPSPASIVQLIDSTGVVIDQVARSGQLVALAGLGPDLEIRALSADGRVVASCPPASDPGYECTRTNLGRQSVTTVPSG